MIYIEFNVQGKSLNVINILVSFGLFDDIDRAYMYRYVQLFRYCNDYGGYNLFDSAKKATHLEASTVMMSVISINIFCTIKTLLTLRVLIPIT